jgi:hypothetical protein
MKVLTSDRIRDPQAALDTIFQNLHVSECFYDAWIGVVGDLYFAIEGDTLTVGIHTDLKETFRPFPTAKQR